MIAMSEEQFAEEDARVYRARRRAQCLDFLKHGLVVIYDKCLLMELEITAKIRLETDVDVYKEKLKTMLRKTAREIYGEDAYKYARHKASVDYAKYGVD